MKSIKLSEKETKRENKLTKEVSLNKEYFCRTNYDELAILDVISFQFKCGNMRKINIKEKIWNYGAKKNCPLRKEDVG